MENPSLQIGDNNWAVKDGSILGYNIIQDNYLPQPITFTRASTATRVNESGLIEEVATGVPRIDYTGGGFGKLLLEQQRSNSVLYSQEIDNTYWLKTNLNTAGSWVNVGVSPDGTLNADNLISDTSLAAHRISRNDFITYADNTFFTTSVFLKKNPHPYVLFSLVLRNGSTFVESAAIQVNLTTKSIAVQSVSTFQSISGTIENYNDDWVRVTLTAKTPTTGATRLDYQVSLTDDLYNSYAGNDVDGVFCWGMQCESSASYATSYIPTTTTAVTRVADSASKSGISSLIGQTQGTVFFDLNNVTGTVTGTGNPEIAFRNTALTNWMGVTTNIFASPFRFTFRSATTLINYSANITRAKVACSYGAFGVKLFVNGALVASSVTIPTTTFDLLDLKGGIIKSELTSVMSFLLPKSDAELIALTTL